jgi:small-conductance mechanosensitive channel
VGLTWLATNTGNYAETRVKAMTDLSPSLQVLIGKFIKIFLVVVAIVIGLNSAGIDLTAFAVFSGAIGVGLGFGLQKVVSNFISGVIILLDKSIKPGDTISVGETFGWIRELRSRFVSVVTRDGREFLIPNEDFITEKVINWSFSDKLVRLDVEFGVAYDSDPHLVSKMVIKAIEKIERVSSKKSPVCWLIEFGDSSLNFKTRFWISDPQNGLTNIRGQVMLAIWDAFKKNNIGIPFPHTEIIMKAPVEIVQSKGKPK